MVLSTIRSYLFLYMIWRLFTYTTDNGRPGLNMMENMYVIVSEFCTAITDFYVSTKEDEDLIQNTVHILQFHHGVVTWYPINRRLENIDKIIIAYMTIETKENYTNPSETKNVSSQEDIYLYFSNNKSLIRVDENGTQLQPVTDFHLRKERSDKLDERKEKGKSTQSPENIVKMFKKDVPNLPVKNDNIKSVNINKLKNTDEIYDFFMFMDSSTYDNMSAQLKNESHSDENNEEEDVDEDEDDSKYWYPVNDTFIAIKRPNINVKTKTKLIIHGFGAMAEDNLTTRLALIYYKFTVYNVLVVDAELVLGEIYFKSVRNARLLGKAIADVIIYLETFGADAADFHLLGVSLGAHAAGWAGQYFRHRRGRLIGRITGLDPAGPCFTHMPINDRLDKTDALYVDVIHTNTLVEGIPEPIGHSDFYVNGGGPVQPGCILPACSHLYAVYVFKLSVVFPSLFISIKCDNWSQFLGQQCSNRTVLMGEESDPSTRGLYYIRTQEEVPYGLGMAGIRPEK